MLNESTPSAPIGKNVLFPLPGGPAMAIITGRAALLAVTAGQPVSTLVIDAGRMSGGSSCETR